MAKRYTYEEFSEDILEMLENLTRNGEVKIGDYNVPQMLEKAKDYAKTVTARKESNAKKVTAPKGPSDETLDKVDALRMAISPGIDYARTTQEINEMGGTEYTPLALANIAKYLEGCKTTKVIREVTGKDGLKSERHYTAYYIEEETQS